MVLGLLHGHAEAVHLHPPTRAAEQAKRRVPADGAAATRAKKGKKAAQADEAAGLDVSAAPRAMLQLVQGISFDDWEEMLLPTREPTAEGEPGPAGPWRTADRDLFASLPLTPRGSLPSISVAELASSVGSCDSQCLMPTW